MLKFNLKRLALFPLLPAAGDVLAHPGSHAEFGGWEQVAHFLSNPDHVGMLVGGGTGFAGNGYLERRAREVSHAHTTSRLRV